MVQIEVRSVGGETGRALAAAQGRALADLLTALTETSVQPDEQPSGGSVHVYEQSVVASGVAAS
jgi:hypothetical protein